MSIRNNNQRNNGESCKSTDFVTKYVELLSRITDAPREFQEAAALFLLSTAAGRKWVFQSLPETAIFGDKAGVTGKLLNLWFIIIGKSRITRKSSGVINHVEEISKKVLGEHRLLSKAFTPEFLIKEMSEKSALSATQDFETVCCWISDEIAWFFQQLKKKSSYMTNADSFLSKIYDGHTYTRGTIGRDRETVSNPYLTCLLASTDYLPTLFDELKIRIGFMNRFIYVIGKRKKRKPLRTEPLTEEEKEAALEIEAFLNALVKRVSITVLKMSSEAEEVYNSFEEEIEKRIETEKLGIKEGYYGNLPNLVVRLACLYRISRMMPEEIKNYHDTVLIVKKQDVERAIDYAQRAWKWFDKVIELMQTDSGKAMKLGDQVESAILRVLEDGKAKHYKVILQEIERMGIGGCQATVYHKLKKLRNEGKISHPRQGYFQIVKKKEDNQRGDDDGGRRERRASTTTS